MNLFDAIQTTDRDFFLSAEETFAFLFRKDEHYTAGLHLLTNLQALLRIHLIYTEDNELTNVQFGNGKITLVTTLDKDLLVL